MVAQVAQYQHTANSCCHGMQACTDPRATRQCWSDLFQRALHAVPCKVVSWALVDFTPRLLALSEFERQRAIAPKPIEPIHSAGVTLLPSSSGSACCPDTDRSCTYNQTCKALQNVITPLHAHMAALEQRSCTQQQQPFSPNLSLAGAAYMIRYTLLGRLTVLLRQLAWYQLLTYTGGGRNLMAPAALHRLACKPAQRCRRGLNNAIGCMVR